MSPEASTDSELWLRIRDGDVSAFGALHGRHINRIYRHCYARLGSRTEAEEAANQTFFELWRKRHSIQIDHRGALAWLMVAAGNVCRNHTRSRHRQRSLLRRLAGRSAGHEAVDVDDRADASRYTAALRSALSRLTAANQDVIALCALEGVSYEEAAGVLGIPVGTVRSRLSRAKAELRRSLAHAGITAQSLEEKEEIPDA